MASGPGLTTRSRSRVCRISHTTTASTPGAAVTARSGLRATSCRTSLECDATGTLDRVERVTRFTAVTVAARLSVPEGSDPEKARRVLEKAEAACLITSSMNAEVHLEADVTVA